MGPVRPSPPSIIQGPTKIVSVTVPSSFLVTRPRPTLKEDTPLGYIEAGASCMFELDKSNADKASIIEFLDKNKNPSK